VKRRLQEHGITARIPVKKEFLTEHQKWERYQFALKYANKDADWWNGVSFTDESSVG